MLILERLFNTGLLYQLTFYIYCLSLVLYICTFVSYIRHGRRFAGTGADTGASTGIGTEDFRSYRKFFSLLATSLFVLGFVLNVVLVVDRWFESGRPPFKTLYETLIYASFTIGLVYIFVERFFKIKVLGILVSLLIVVIFLYSLNVLDVEILPLMPALQTPIMVPHVTSYFFAYAGVFVAGLVALLSLILPKGISGYWLISDSGKINFGIYVYKIVKFAFLFLTLGLVLGSWWGQVAWSNYWGWDPKENWALISWLVLASYFHARYMKGWAQRKLAFLVVIASLTILFTYLGMKYLPRDVQSASLHVYIEE